MAYTILVRPDARRYLPDIIPQEAKDAIAIAFDAIKRDPMGSSRVPACPPHVPHGRLHEFHVDINNRRHYFSIFFEIDEERKELGVTHISIQPRFPD